MHASTSRALALASACTCTRTRVQSSLGIATKLFALTGPRRHQHHDVCNPRTVVTASRPTCAARHRNARTLHRRWLSTDRTSGESPLHNLKNTHASTLIYVSTSTNPYHNLSLEHHLLTHSPPTSHVLFLYTNRPCVVIGRNQNPWVECNLRAILAGLPPMEDGKVPPHPTQAPGDSTAPNNDRIPIDVVRRRSGGGTVFHGPGNLNYCTITPNDRNFSRRTHAELVVRALRSLPESEGFRARFPKFRSGSVRVNERHDIVMRDPSSGVEGKGEGEEKWLKVSGSAFKLTRQRALHHGTLLLSSPYLGFISGLLRNPWKGNLKTKGVESVRSPVGNLYEEDGLGEEGREELTGEVIRAVVAEFSQLYGEGGNVEAMEIGDEDVKAVAEVGKGVAELDSREWKGGQTPRFIFEYSSRDGGNRLEMEFVRGRIDRVGVGHDEGKELVTMQLAKNGTGWDIGRDVFEWSSSKAWQRGIQAAIGNGAPKEPRDEAWLDEMSCRDREQLTRLARDVGADDEISQVVRETFPAWLPQ